MLKEDEGLSSHPLPGLPHKLQITINVQEEGGKKLEKEIVKTVLPTFVCLIGHFIDNYL